MRKLSIPLRLAACVAALSAFTADAESVTAWADDAIAVDASDFRSVLGSATLRYSPDWCTGGTNVSGATYSLSVVTAPDTASAVTSAVPVLAAAEEGNVAYSGSGCVRFIMKAESGGAAVGETLVQDVSFGAPSRRFRRRAGVMPLPK